MNLSECFPVWDRLDAPVRQTLEESAQLHHAPVGHIIHDGSENCTGLILIRNGRLRVYSPSEDGREITLFRLLDRDMCLFSASCMIHEMQLELAIQAETETDFWLIPPDIYKAQMEVSPALSAFTSRLTAGRFADVMWLVNQILWKRMDQRLAAFLLEEASLQGSNTLRLTHEAIGRHLGTAREVVTRMLKYLRDEGWVRLSRGEVQITNAQALKRLANE